jgi:cysteine desulfuration protein SufE
VGLAEKQRQLVTTLAACRSPQDRLAWMVNAARHRPSLDADHRTEAHRVEGCLVSLWLVAECRDGRCWFTCDSDSLIVKAIAGLLCDFYSGEPPVEILKMDPSFLAEVGITQHLTPNRRHSLARVWETIRAFALAATPATASSPPNP